MAVAHLADVLLVVPTLNEEQGLPGVLEDARRLGVATLVLDGGSEDRTREIASEYNVPVVRVSRGKARGWREFVTSKDFNGWKRLAMVDGDGTYDLEALPLMAASSADMVVALRRGVPGETPRVRAMGARALSVLAGLVTGRKCPDLLSGMRVINVERLRQINLTTSGFELETELTLEFVRRGFQVDWVPVIYRRRRGRSKLSPVREGIRILWAIFRVRTRAV
ncbi:MAG: glycosyltransferase [Chloroflexi bacterium]|nr:glycosyltransferase [Chloroflexota bacterium]